MEKWWKQSFINRRDWILEHFDKFGFSDKEGVLVLLIDFFNEQRQPISLELLSRRSGYSLDEVDRVLSILAAKHYLKIASSKNTVSFQLDGLFEASVTQSAKALDVSLFELFESEFGRPLSQNEMTMLSGWIKQNDSKLVVYALKEACMYRKKNFNYIDRILAEWNAKGVTVKTMEESSHDENE